jgi:YVTN family beta-propeller protein
VLVISSLFCAAQSIQVGQSRDGSYVVPTSQLIRPAGESLAYSFRPYDLALSPDAKFLFVKSDQGLVVVDTAVWKILQTLPIESGSSIHGIAVNRDGSRLFVTSSLNLLCEGEISPTGTVAWVRKIALLGKGGRGYSGPCGVALSKDEKTAYVCLSIKNTLAEVSLESGKLVREIPVGVAPYDVVMSDFGGPRAFVSNWGGRLATAGQKTADSYGTPVLIDKRGIALSGTVSIVDLSQNKEIRQLPVGLHPSGLALSKDGRVLYVANANSDTVSVIDTDAMRVLDSVSVRPDPSLPFGSQPNALALGKDGDVLYVANAGNNALALLSVRGDQQTHPVVKGFIPTGWFPGAVATDARHVYVANVRGYGSRSNREKGKMWNCGWFLGTLNRVDVPAEDKLKEYTSQVLADARVPEILRAQERAQTDKKPVPVPERVGEPSTFEHIVYIIKENRTYDQLLGDMPQANGDSNLCIFGREITPNHHKLAEEFALLDNYYCNGAISREGHRWATEGNITAMFQKNLFSLYRGDALGVDPLNFSSSGFIWDHVLLHGLSFRDYGEMGKGWYSTRRADPHHNPTLDMLEHPDDYTLSNQPNPGIDALAAYSCPQYPGFQIEIPDILRARVFLDELHAAEKNGRWPNLMILCLPDDHTGGGFVTARAQVADNDLAVGRIVEGISRSKFWPKTCIFVNEDDPQDGFDHVDGHRSLCLIVSPYTKRGQVVSHFYNQASVLHTIELMLGIPPMNQMDALSPAMVDCFTNTPDFSPYTAAPNQIPLTETPRPIAQLHGKELYWAKKLAAMRFDAPDLNDDDTLNHILWHSVKGVDAPYPAAFAGAHGKGLRALSLKLAPTATDDD